MDGPWKYRKPITIDNTGNSSLLVNYQIQITITYNGNMKSDFGDIRFTNTDGVELLNYYLESYIDSTSAIFWIKVPSVPALSLKTIYMYYGNSEAISASNGDNTFEFFDDFASDLEDVKWWPVRVEQGDATLPVVSGGKLYCSIGTATQASASARFSINNELAGDFDAQVDVTAFNSNSGDFSAAEFHCYSKDLGVENYAYIRLDKNATGQKAWGSNIYIGGVSQGYQYTNTSASTGKLRITRSGGTITTYYWNGSSWTQLNQAANFPITPVRCYLGARSWSNYPDNVNCIFDNFVVENDSVHSDDFNDNVVDRNKWNLGKTGQASYSTESGGQLNCNAGTVITETSRSYAGNRIASVRDDFEAIIDFSDFTAPAQNTSYIRMYFWVNAYNSIFVALRKNATNMVYHAQIMKGGSTNSYSSSATNDINGKLKIRRIGSTVSAYYWNGSIWIQLANESSFSLANAELDIGVMSWDTFPDNVSANFDNVLVRKYSNPDPSYSFGNEEICLSSGGFFYEII